MTDRTIPGYMTESELTLIEQLANQVPENGVIVEVGSYLGLSASAWATCHPSVKVYCIDKFHIDNQLEMFKNNTSRWPNIIPIKGNSPFEIEYPGDPIDIFFLDGAHVNPSDVDNINFFLPMIKPGGLLCGHDYIKDIRDYFPFVRKNVFDLERRLNIRPTVYPNTTIWSFRLPA